MAFPVFLLRLCRFLQRDVTGTVSAIFLQGDAEGLHVIELLQPFGKLTAHDVRVALVFPSLSVDDQQRA